MWRGMAVIKHVGVWGKTSASDILSENDKKEWKKSPNITNHHNKIYVSKTSFKPLGINFPSYCTLGIITLYSLS